jgi:pimeloyl-ACP methyl ester carboxylesterase
MRNYGPTGYLWELWHEGPIRDRQNVVLVHGYRLPLTVLPGRCDEQFAELDSLLQASCDCNVWQFEYVGSPFGTYDSVSVYASRLDAALNRISEITGNDRFSMVGYSMGGLIARQFIAMGGKSRVDKLLTLATPHMGVHLEPFDIPHTERFYPRGGIQMRPDSRLLWDLNTNIESSTVSEFASVAGHWRGSSDGAVEMGSASLVKWAWDGSVEQSFYFAGVPRSHQSINRIRTARDEVFRLVRGFVAGGVPGISRERSSERPGDYLVPFFLTFAVKKNPDATKHYPYVVATDSGHCYRGPRIWTQGALTDNGAQIYTVRLRAREDGEIHIFHAPGQYAAVHVESGQSVVVSQPIGAGAGPTLGFLAAK